MNILIIEDEPKTALLLKELIEWHHAYNVVAICDSVETAVAYLREHQHALDVVFMDIQLSDGQCFEIFDKIAVALPVVFCTSYNEFMLKAFKNNGIDYILKPFGAADIRETIAKIEALKGRFAENAYNTASFKAILTDKPTYATNFLVRFREKLYPVAVADIAFMYLEHEMVALYNFNGEKHTIIKTLNEIESTLAPNQFYRINRQMIVNRQAIASIEPYFNNKIVVHLSLPTPENALVARLKVSPFLAWVENG